MNVTLFMLAVILLVEVMPIVVLTAVLYRERLRFSPWLSVTLAFVTAAVTIFFTLRYGTFQELFFGWRLIYSLLVMVLYFFLGLLMTRAPLAQMMFFLYLFKGMNDTLSLVADAAITLLQREEVQNPWLLQPRLWQLFFLALVLPLMLWVTRVRLRPLAADSAHLGFWKYLWLIPASIYLIFRLNIYPGYLGDSAPWNDMIFLMPFIWILATTFTYFAALHMVDETLKNGKLQEQLHLSDLQVSLQRSQYESLQETIQESYQIRHDIRHQLRVLQAYLEDGQVQEARAFLHNLLQRAEPEMLPPLCENPAADMIARYYLTIAKAKGIEVTAALQFPRSLPMEDSDLCVMLGNLLENALEACQRQTGERWIRVRATVNEQGMLVIAVSNSFTGQLQRQGEVFLSSKRDGPGKGILSVQTIARRYEGITKFEQKDGVFTASVLLNTDGNS